MRQYTSENREVDLEIAVIDVEDSQMKEPQNKLVQDEQPELYEQYSSRHSRFQSNSKLKQTHLSEVSASAKAEMRVNECQKPDGSESSL